DIVEIASRSPPNQLRTIYFQFASQHLLFVIFNCIAFAISFSVRSQGICTCQKNPSISVFSSDQKGSRRGTSKRERRSSMKVTRQPKSMSFGVGAWEFNSVIDYSIPSKQMKFSAKWR